MAILLDQPRWAAHSTLWAHLVSDASLSELHEFAAAAGIPARGFDHDHYDAPLSLHGTLLELGAEEVTSGELARRLLAAGLRVPTRDRTPSRAAAQVAAQQRWAELFPRESGIGSHLLELWNQPSRHYHDVRHLAHVLSELDSLTGGEVERPVALAAWFHDAVYDGNPGNDEAASAALAEEVLEEVIGKVEAREVARLVLLTTTHQPAANDERGALLSDADLAILGALQGRYHVYLRDVRRDYAHVSDPDFQSGRRRVVASLLDAERLFHTEAGVARWELRARENLGGEADNGNWPRL